MGMRVSVTLKGSQRNTYVNADRMSRVLGTLNASLAIYGGAINPDECGEHYGIEKYRELLKEAPGLPPPPYKPRIHTLLGGGGHALSSGAIRLLQHAAPKSLRSSTNSSMIDLCVQLAATTRSWTRR